MRVARVVQKWYECVSVFVALAVTHPVVYMGHSVTWDPRVRALLFDQVDLLRLWQAWPVFLGWVSLCVVANSIMLLVICARMLDWRTRAMNSTGATSLTSSSTNCSNSSSAMWAEHFVCPFRRQQQRHEVRLVALRIGLYALVPVVTEIWAIAYALARGHAMWLKEMASVMACTQGVVCLLLLAVNPACDGFWLMLREHRSGLKEAKREEQCLNFCHLDASTIHLSPYHSRSNSIS
ncbi:hypothetical protein GGF43_002488 [Coemansia sp. RSA 2618]|nr:hypothetical protein GGF43_002488 [Coemansia sp. RSA 2618]